MKSRYLTKANKPGMKTSAIQIKVDDNKNYADIALNGVTVISGPQGSGKSTLLSFIKLAMKFIVEFSQNTAEEIEINMEFFQFDIHDFLKSKKKGYIREVMKNPGEKYFLRKQKSLLNLVDRLEKYCMKHLSMSKTDVVEKMYSKELGNIFRSLQIRKPLDEITLEEFTEELRIYINSKFSLMNEKLTKRSFSYIDDYYLFEIESLSRPKNFEIRSKDSIIISSRDTCFSSFPDVKKIITGYYDGTPGVDWSILRSELKVRRLDEDILELFRQLTEGVELIIPSKKHLSNEKICASKILCRQADGKEVPLISFKEDLQNILLFKLSLITGRIDKNSIVVIDKPDIIQYKDYFNLFASLACLLNKRYGIRFLFSTGLDEMKKAFQEAAIAYNLGNRFKLYEEVKESPYKYRLLPV